ncbi:MAG: hypothetical protein HOW73_35720 [Polyangiaceae bacterium]|nr:hypothetical protein [Polyangiaceae bacterium]
MGVALYAWLDIRRRRDRNEWTRTLDVAVVFVVREPVSETAVEQAKARTTALADHLKTEMIRYRPGYKPFQFHPFGPVFETDAPPKAGEPGIVSDTRFAYESWRYTSKVDDLAGLKARYYDARIYVVLTPPTNQQRKQIEGASEQGGRIGIVEVELDDTMVDFALFVVAHELFHTLGASDKYDASARVLVPDGLAEPDLVPMYPQRYVELMARHRPVDPVVTKPPKSIDELRVGPATAREIGWSADPNSPR